MTGMIVNAAVNVAIYGAPFLIAARQMKARTRVKEARRWLR